MAADRIVEAVDVTADCDRGFDPVDASSDNFAQSGNRIAP